MIYTIDLAGCMGGWRHVDGSLFMALFFLFRGQILDSEVALCFTVLLPCRDRSEREDVGKKQEQPRLLCILVVFGNEM